MRSRLLTAVSFAALAAAPALADEEVTDERTEQIRTSDADGQGTADNVVITSSGRVVLDNPGPAIVLDSDHDVTIENGGEIDMAEVDGATGVQAIGGNTGSITHGGTIDLTEEYSPSDSGTDDLADRDGDGEDDPDNDPDGPFAQQSNKTGLLIGEVDTNLDPLPGQSALTGDVTTTSGSGIQVDGQDSFGVRTVTAIDGDLLLGGGITVTGERSTGVSIEDAVSGDVAIGGQVTVRSPDGQGVDIDDDVGGGVRISGGITVNGYRISGRSAQEVFEVLDAGDDDLSAGAALVIAGSVQDGVFIADGAGVEAIGDAPAVELRPAADASADMQIGTVALPDDYGVSEDEADEDSDPELRDDAFIVEGEVRANGLFDGRDATAFFIAGRDVSGTLRAVILAGDGFRNAGSIVAEAFDADATAARFGEGAQADTINNSGEIRASVARGFEDDGFGDGSFGEGRAFALMLEEGSSIRRVLNSGDILATISGAGQSATAITVGTEDLNLVRNTGRIAAVAGNLADDAQDPELIAIDASSRTTGLRVVQRRASGSETAPSIEGDIRFGAGDDELRVLAGSVDGDIFFGDGADLLVIDGADINGGLADSDGQLVIDLANGRIGFTGSDTLEITEAVFRDGATLDITVDDTTRVGAFIEASGAIEFQAGSDLTVSLSELIGDGREFELITAGSLNIADEDAILTAADTPFLYKTTLERDGADPNTLILTLERKTAGELGMNANQAAAFNEALAAMDAVDSLGAAIAALRTEEAFFRAYDQLLPEYAGSAIQFALASNDAGAGALDTRLRNARLSPDDLAGVWAQEFAYFADRGRIDAGQGYRGDGIGLAVGVDRPIGPFYAVGFNVIGASSDIEETDGEDEPMVAYTAQLGAYAGLDVGGFDASGSLGVGYDRFESERRILIDDFSAVNSAEWSGWHATASAKIGRDFTFNRWVVRPEAALTYMALFESGYSETSESALEGLELIVDDRETSTLIGAATLELSRNFGNQVSWWRPSFRVGARGEFAGEAGETVAQFRDGNPFRLQAEELPGTGLILGLGLSAGSNYSTFTFAYDADVRDDFVRHVARLMIRLTF
ncbi:hypothetical protein DDZ18_06230 [Marinicauda salina]|uniref:Autotransporter domain-containing protein n=1 Tax=Marinicauda salina TaxID=2135793 RepID=A0A2U2BTE3_9PROT|nr:autotransporter outer membrane beta-barrel domain-containing protein [Marinicauda salina]PWE17283.1 hypothetical protein DDZ18_06230 [Marinicauda salina]